RWCWTSCWSPSCSSWSSSRAVRSNARSWAAPSRRYRADVSFYGEVLRELVVAFGAALFVANRCALLRGRADRPDAAREDVARARPGSPVRKQVRVATTGRLAEAPLA